MPHAPGEWSAAVALMTIGLQRAPTSEPYDNPIQANDGTWWALDHADLLHGPFRSYGEARDAGWPEVAEYRTRFTPAPERIYDLRYWVEILGAMILAAALFYCLGAPHG